MVGALEGEAAREEGGLRMRDWSTTLHLLLGVLLLAALPLARHVQQIRMPYALDRISPSAVRP